MNTKHYKKHDSEEIAALGVGFYNTKEWKHKRAEILRRDHNECVRCRTVHHRHTPANTVHHIQHLDTHPDLALNDDNLVSLCADCHNEVHPEKLKKILSRPEKFDDERW